MRLDYKSTWFIWLGRRTMGVWSRTLVSGRRTYAKNFTYHHDRLKYSFWLLEYLFLTPFKCLLRMYKCVCMSYLFWRSFIERKDENNRSFVKRSSSAKGFQWKKTLQTLNHLTVRITLLSYVNIHYHILSSYRITKGVRNLKTVYTQVLDRNDE